MLFIEIYKKNLNVVEIYKEVCYDDFIVKRTI